MSEAPIWWPPTKIVGQRLAPFLASVTGEAVVSDVPPPGDGVPVDMPLDASDIDQLTTSRLDVSAVLAPPTGATVSSVMSREQLLVTTHMTLDVLATKMRERDVGSALVLEGERLVGILTARDVLRALAGNVSAAETYVRQWMTAEPIAVGSDTTLAAAEALMSEYCVHHLPVVDEEHRPIGMVGLRDVARVRRVESRPAVGLGF